MTTQVAQGKVSTGRPSRWAACAGPAVVVVAAAATVWVAQHRARGDFTHMLEPMQRLVAGDLSNVYADSGFGTSLTAWLAVTAAPFLLGRTISSDQGAWVLAGLVAVPLLVAAVRFTVRAINPAVTVVRAWLLAGLAVILPTTLASWTEYYHPQDVAGAALLVFALGFAARRQWAWSGLLFGLAILTRQWALLAAVMVAPLTGTRRDFLRFAGVGAAVCASGFVPWVLLGNDGAFMALTGSRAAITAHTFVGRLVGEGNGELLAAVRLVPPVVAAGVAAWLAVTRRANLHWLAPLAVSALALRMLFDVAAYTYYWAPICILMLVVRGPKWVTPIVAVAASTLAWVVYPHVASSGRFGELLTAIWVPVILAAFVIAAWWLNDDAEPGSEPGGHTEPSRTPAWLWAAAALTAAAVITFGAVTVAQNEKELPDGTIPAGDFNGAGSLTGTGAPLAVDAAGNLTGVLPRFDATSPSGEPAIVEPGVTRAVVVTSHWCLDCAAALTAAETWAADNGVPTDQIALVGVDADPARGNWPPELWLLSLGWPGPAFLDDAAGQAKTLLGSPTPGTVLIFDASGNVIDVIRSVPTAQR